MSFDIPVANLPVESYGTDKQLDAAIREVLKEIKASPDVKIPEHPQFPRSVRQPKCLADNEKNRVVSAIERSKENNYAYIVEGQKPREREREREREKKIERRERERERDECAFLS